MSLPPGNSFNPLDYPLCLAVPTQVDALSWHEHIPFAMTLVQLLSPRVVVELGVHTGDSYLAFCQAVAATGGRAAVYGVDTWHGDAHADFYGQEVLDKLRRHHDPIYGAFSRLVQSTFDEAAEHFAEGSVDLLHIDGFHSYEAVLHDWQTWQPKLSPRGVALLHDTNVREREFGVWRLWGQLAERYPHLLFAHGHGLGVLAVGPEAPELLRPLLAVDAQRRALLQELFFKLGHSITLSKEKAMLETRLSAEHAEARRLEAKVADLTLRLSAQSTRVTALLSSTSWRLTAPLRWIQTKLLGLTRRG